MREIENKLDVFSSKEKYLVEVFTEGDELIFETKFEKYNYEGDVEFYKDEKNFSYKLNFYSGTNKVLFNLVGPEINVHDRVEVMWTWNTNGVKPGSYEAEAVIIGPDQIPIESPSQVFEKPARRVR